LVVAVGGDGTMNEVASALVGTGAIFGLIPCGSGNGLGRYLGIHGPLEHTLDTILCGQPRMIDTGEVNGRPFFNAMGLGFDAAVSHRFQHLSKRGLYGYVKTALPLLRDFRPQEYTIRSGGRVFSAAALLVAVANSDQYGNNCYIAPGARIDDGQLDLTLISGIHLLDAFPLIARLFRGCIDESPGVHRERAATFSITWRGPAFIHTDGEPYQVEDNVEISTRPMSLRVLVPALPSAAH
jgi:YegS/Rv2252/BmrU family lipid kinase